MTLAQLGFEPLQPPSNKKGREGTLAPSRSCEFTQDSERRSNPLSHRPWNLSHLRFSYVSYSGSRKGSMKSIEPGQQLTATFFQSHRWNEHLTDLIQNGRTTKLGISS